MSTKITLDQWQALIAVVDEGGYAAAAEALDKSQSAISYAVQKIETELGVRAFALEGRRAKLTETGSLLYRQAKVLVDEAGRIENTAIRFGHGWEPLVRLTADGLFPQDQVLCALVRLASESPLTRVEFQETVLSGSEEALLRHEADVVITGRVPPGFMGDHLSRIRFVAVAAPDGATRAPAPPPPAGDPRFRQAPGGLGLAGRRAALDLFPRQRAPPGVAARPGFRLGAGDRNRRRPGRRPPAAAAA